MIAYTSGMPEVIAQLSRIADALEYMVDAIKKEQIVEPVIEA